MNRIVNFFFGKPAQTIKLANNIDSEKCPNCGATIKGKYCSNCGQKSGEHQDYRISHFLGEVFHLFTHFDSKFFATFRYLIVKPGYLTEQFITGHRKKYMNPIQLFLICNIIYFLLSGANTFTQSLELQMSDVRLPLKNRLVTEKLASKKISYKDYETDFNRKEDENAKTLVFVMIPVFAMFLSLMFLGQRRYFVEHLVFALNFFSFMLLFQVFGLVLVIASIILISIPVFWISGGIHEKLVQLGGFLNSDGGSTILVSLILWIYLFFAIKRVYSQSNTEAFLKSFVSVILFWLIIIFIYRNVLFLVTFYGLKLSLH